jgi:N-methylhydantoinase A
MKYYCGVDTGGTFTDCAVIDGAGRIAIAKRPSTPHDYSEGLFDALAACAERIGIDLAQLLEHTEHLFLGTTVGTNALLQMKGARSGLITTRGHRDNLAIMRSAGRSAGLPIEQLLHVSRHTKPPPLIPQRRIREVSERVDWKGAVFLPLNESEVEEAAAALLAEGVEAIAVCLLWSIANPAHEQRIRDILGRVAPGVFVSCSHELIAKRGEYERTVGTAINCFIGPAMNRYLRDIEARATALGYRKPILVLQVTGGVVPSREVTRTPLYTIGSGPAAGVTGSLFLARAMSAPNVVITDMGGTSFETGLIYQGHALTASETIVNQYVFQMPRLDVQSIGAGGGSILWIDEGSRTLKVGPQSAGAEPGPACYGRGTQPTITDANLVLGYLNPDNFLGGTMRLSRDQSIAAIRPLAERLDMTVPEAAAGAVRIAETQMAELIRQMTLQRGLDPREFVLYAYGGAGPAHACQYARELDIGRVVVPLGTISSTWSAFGALCADVLHVYEQSALLSEPFDLRRINECFAALEARGLRQLADDGVDRASVGFRRFVEMKYKMQIHQIEVPVPAGVLGAEHLPQVLERFERIYEGFYGAGSAYRQAGVEIGLFKVHAVGAMVKPRLPEPASGGADPILGHRQAYWRDAREWLDTPVYAGERLAPGLRVRGPAIVEYAQTTVVVPAFASGEVDRAGSFLLDLEGGGA